jgi:hypothetical protein
MSSAPVRVGTITTRVLTIMRSDEY